MCVIFGYEETDNAPTRFLIDNIRAEFVNSGYRIIAKSGEEDAKAQGIVPTATIPRCRAGFWKLSDMVYC